MVLSESGGTRKCVDLSRQVVAGVHLRILSLYLDTYRTDRRGGGGGGGG